MALVAVFVVDAAFRAPEWQALRFAAYLMYAAGLALGGWLVRPRPGREWLFPWIMLPVTIQVGTYLVTWAVIAALVRIHGWPLLRSDPVLPEVVPLALLSLALVLLGPLMPFLLAAFTRRAAVLVFVEVLGPLLVFGLARLRL